MNAFELEICVDSPDNALLAMQSGATRLALCSNLVIGGTTPPASLMALTRELVDIPIHGLIRPRFGDFLYTPLELELMKRDIVTCKQHMLDGVVLGALTANGCLDVTMLQTLIQLSKEMHLTLSRVFDFCREPFETLEVAIDLGFQTVLTSGHARDALSGSTFINKLIEKADGRIQIMPCGGINAKNIEEIAKITHASHFHMSAKELTKSLMIYQNPSLATGVSHVDESLRYGIYENEIATVKQFLETF